MRYTLLILIALTATAPLAGAQLTREPQITHHDARLTLRGHGVLKVGYVFRVYDAGLYVGESAATASVLDDVPKRLELNYLRAIRAADIVEIAQDTLIRQETEATRRALQERLEVINHWYVDVKPGDQYSLTYVPGKGSELALNGKLLGTIEGADFARAYFGIWLDPRTKYQSFRSMLMGEEKG